MWPTCSKKDEDGTKQLIIEINDKLKKTHGFPLVNISTDGDGTRRIVSNQLMQIEVNEDYPWFYDVQDLPLIDYVAGPDGLTYNEL